MSDRSLLVVAVLSIIGWALMTIAATWISYEALGLPAAIGVVGTSLTIFAAKVMNGASNE